MTTKRSQLIPESNHPYKDLSMDEILDAQQNNTTITGFVKWVDANSKVVIVSFGNNISGEIPFEETTIYPFKYTAKKSIPTQILCLVGDKVRVKVTDVNETSIKLSRKANMLEALKLLEGCTAVNCRITSVLPRKAFADIGEGINACVDIREVCKCRISNISHYIKPNDNIWLNIIDKNELNQFILSYKSTFTEYCPEDYIPEECLEGIVTGSIPHKTPGYFVSITPQVCGIMDVSPDTPILHEGDRVVCKVKRAVSEGLKLEFLFAPRKEFNKESISE